MRDRRAPADREEPRRELPPRLVTVEVLPRLHERLLGELLGVVRRAHASQQEVEQPPLEAIDQLDEALHRPRLGALDHLRRRKDARSPLLAHSPGRSVANARQPPRPGGSAPPPPRRRGSGSPP